MSRITGALSARGPRRPAFPAYPWRLVLLRSTLVLPATGAAALLALASLFPLRLERRNFQDLARAADSPRGVPQVFVSAGDDPAAYRFAGYALHNLAYPRPEALWLRLSGTARGRGLRLDEHGRVWRAAGSGEEPFDTAALPALVSAGSVLYDADATRVEAERRLPLLARAAHAGVIAPQPSGFARRAPSSAFSVVRLMRLSALVGIATTLVALLRCAGASAAVARAASAPVALALLLVTLSLSQVLPLRAPGVWPYVVWSACAATLALRRPDGRPPAWRSRSARGAGVAALFVLACAAALFVARLDFDEDAHSHWLLQARAYFDAGRHVPETLRDAHIHAATYPYGYSQALALCAWAADLDPERFLWLDDGTGLALLLYRLGVAALAVSALGLLAAHLRDLGARLGLTLAGPALVLTLFPVFQGRHLAAETLLLPLFAAALLLITSGGQAGRGGLVALGLFVAGATTLVKLEGALLLGACVLPWALSRRVPGRARQAAALALGLLPTLVWRATLEVANPVYVTPTPVALAQALPVLPQVLLWCAQAVLRENLGWPLLVALPLAAAWRVRHRAVGDVPWRALLVPVSIYAGALALAAIYLFTTLPRAWQIEVSYPRLLLVPLFSALLYALETLALAEARGDPHHQREGCNAARAQVP